MLIRCLFDILFHEPGTQKYARGVQADRPASRRKWNLEVRPLPLDYLGGVKSGLYILIKDIRGHAESRPVKGSVVRSTSVSKEVKLCKDSTVLLGTSCKALCGDD